MNFFSGVILYLSQDSAKIMTDVEEYEDWIEVDIFIHHHHL